MAVARLIRRAVLAGLMAVTLSGCAAGRLLDAAPPVPPEKLTEEVVVLDDGWHTEILLQAGSLDGGLRELRASFPTASWISFSFGERRYELQEKHNAFDNLLAILPGPGIVMVIGHSDALNNGDASMHVTRLRVSRAGLEHLVDFIWNDFHKDEVANIQMLRNAPEWNMRVYASSASYDGTYTCNTWTLEALRAAGLETSPAGVLFASQAMEQIGRVARAQGGTLHVDTQAAGNEL